MQHAPPSETALFKYLYVGREIVFAEWVGFFQFVHNRFCSGMRTMCKRRGVESVVEWAEGRGFEFESEEG